MALTGYDPRFLRLLELSPFERRARGWRFGCKTISDAIVERLIASGVAKIEGAKLYLVDVKTTS
jgi:hypothetical protein